jgi:ABC-type antimicrobial peptide transport system permease subunit
MGHEYIREILTVDEQLSQSTRQESLLALASLVFGGSAAMAAFLGLFAMLAYSVARRTREIGIRMAIGASPASVVRLVSAQALTPVLAGIVAGVPCALGTGRLAESLLFGVQPSDPRLIASVALFAAGGAILAAVVPAVRAVRINPVSALRAE